VIPRLVMQGYTVIASEILSQSSRPPSHIFLQAGVGGFAASVVAHIDLLLGPERPKFIIVEPERAACLFESNVVNKPVKVSADQPTVMAMLECYEPSLLAWDILSRLADAYMTVQDDEAISAVRILESPDGDDLPVVSRESGAAGLAGLVAALRSPKACRLLGLGPASRILIVNTEGVLPAFP
ncbi:MAG TPA: pyridoxal-phosphate dependent enzyme, partial [Afipia sp.]